MVSPSSPRPGGSRRPPAGLVLIAAVVGIAVVWAGPSTRPTPPRSGPGGIVSQAAGASFLDPAMGQSTESRLGNVHLASNTTSLAIGTATAVNLYQGVSITLAPGWAVANQGQGYVNLLNRDKTVQLFALAGPTSASDINEEATGDITDAIKGMGLTNVQRDPVGQVQTVQSTNNYEQLVEFGFTGDVQTDQGTQQLFGFWVVLFNSSTHTAGFVNFFSPSPDALNIETTPDFNSMVSSML